MIEADQSSYDKLLKKVKSRGTCIHVSEIAYCMHKSKAKTFGFTKIVNDAMKSNPAIKESMEMLYLMAMHSKTQDFVPSFWSKHMLMEYRLHDRRIQNKEENKHVNF